jgi:hypothetical protein
MMTCTPPGIFSSLGIYGYEAIEWPILAGLVTGDPILLVGNHGSAKTYLCRQLASALNMRFKAYDAAKNLFEDVIGFPDPQALQDGRIGYIPTDISVWGTEFLLVDEISRANPEMQSKWLEIIRNRTVMGKAIDGLQYILAAMNPPSYLGAYPLDAALAGRFTIIATTPDCWDMPDDTRRRILGNWTVDDARFCQSTMPQSVYSLATALPNLLAAARDQFANLDTTVRDRLMDYALNVASYTQTIKRPLDGRRLGMLWRNCLAGVALYLAYANAEIDDEVLDGLLYQILCCSLPFNVVDGEPVSEFVYRTAHDYGMRHLGKSTLQLSGDPCRAAEQYRQQIQTLTSQQHEMMVTYLSECWTSTDLELRPRAAAAVLALQDIALNPAVTFPVDTRLRLLDLLQSVTLPRQDILDENDVAGALSLLVNEDGGRIESAHASMGMRLAITTHTTLPGPDGRDLEFQDAGIVHTYRSLKSLLESETKEMVA